MVDNQINTLEHIFRGLLKEEFTPANMICALHNVLACGKGHKHSGITMNHNRDDKSFKKMMDNLSDSLVHARAIEE